MDLKIDVTGDVQIDRKLLRFAGRTRDASPAFQQIADMLRGLEKTQFDSQGQFASGGWKPLADVTVRLKAAKGLDPRILRATGDLARSLASSGGDHVEQVGPQQLVFGTSVPYAQYHQRGTRRMPQRRPVELREQDRRDTVRILQRYLIEEFE